MALKDHYDYWQEFFEEWKVCKGSKGILGWTAPDDLPVLNNPKVTPLDLSSKYCPEPWWGWDNTDKPLYSVCINLNPGQGGPKQVYLPGNPAYVHTIYADLIKDPALIATSNWHYKERAKKLLDAIGIKSPSLENHLSIELIPWHTGTFHKGAKAYLKQNRNAIFEHCIEFAAEASRHITGPLNKIVILRCTKGNIDMLNKGFKVVGKVDTLVSFGIKYYVFKYDGINDVTFICIWHPHAMNHFPKDLATAIAVAKSVTLP